MEEQLIAYLLNTLDAPAQRQIEAHLAQHPETRAQLALLEQALAPLAADHDAPAPPPRLVERTLAKVAERICAPQALDDLPQAPLVSPASLATPRAWWRRADIVVAASLLLTAVGIGLTVLGRMAGPSSAALTVECKNNLRQFFTALQSYHDNNRRFPDVGRERPRDVAGMVVPILADAGVLPASASIRCPGIGGPSMCQFTLASLRAMSDADFEKFSPSLSMCYAYSLGYHDEDGYHGPGDMRQTALSQAPIMADRPPAEGILKNSINHGGDGQNVLFSDGHVKFLTARKLGTDDIFLNRDDKVAAGVDADDIVLGYSSARPQPRD